MSGGKLIHKKRDKMNGKMSGKMSGKMRWRKWYWTGKHKKMSDKMSGKMSGHKKMSDKMSGDKMSGNKMSGDKMSGDKMSGDKRMSGDIDLEDSWTMRVRKSYCPHGRGHDLAVGGHSAAIFIITCWMPWRSGLKRK